MTAPEKTSRLKRALARLTTPDDELEARDLQEEAAVAGATAMARCSMGGEVCVAGTVKHVVLRPRAGVPTLEAELYDGSGSVTLVFLGRRRIRGIDPGRSLVARGRLTRHEGRPTVYNPAYELKPAGA
ncbi:MAG: nucleic acid binding OB-fold tRNA/helicase-type [Frankiales bacterium]|nr:nucleic acid binding OB-fold tRNA/helicase-type [Frankiales bacterium]